ncbi:hypothetical protein ACOMHN_001525 [Nucella lapillus]
MATASTCRDPVNQECSICHELLTTPKLLPCGHHLCRHCLLTWIQTQTDTLCPLCRCPILLQGQQIETTASEVARLADSFPTDLFMEKLVEAERLLSGDHHCKVCEDVAATALCLQCGDMLCSSCKKVHKKLSMLKNHVVEDLAFLTAQELACRRPSVCQAHPEETCRLYCPSHAESVCWLCASTKHRACSDLTELADKVDEADESLEKMVGRLEVGEREIDRAIALLDQHWEKTEDKARKAIADIEETRHCLDANVQAWEVCLMHQTEKERDYIKASVEEAKDHLLQQKGKLSTHREILQQGQGMRNLGVVGKMMTAMETRVEELDHTAILPSDAKVVSALELALDKEGLSRIQRELSSLGKVCVFPADNVGMVKPETLRFRDKHGGNIKLSNFGQTATKSGICSGSGIVLARDLMKQDFLYEVQIVYDRVTMNKQRRRLDAVTVGAITEAPDSIYLPDSSADLDGAFVKKLKVTQHPSEKRLVAAEGEEEWEGAVMTLTAGDRVGVSLDNGQCLRLHVKGQGRRRGEGEEEVEGEEIIVTIASEVPLPCYPVFELRGKAGQITALPVTKVTTM